MQFTSLIMALLLLITICHLVSATLINRTLSTAILSSSPFSALPTKAPLIPHSYILSRAFPHLARARGSANVHNHCKIPVYVYVCDQSPSCTGTIRVPPGGKYTETYTSRLRNGRSIKISKAAGSRSVLQFEYTVDETRVWVDLSVVGGNPFVNDGMTLQAKGLFHHCKPPVHHARCRMVFSTETNGVVSSALLLFRFSDRVGC